MIRTIFSIITGVLLLSISFSNSYAMELYTEPPPEDDIDDPQVLALGGANRALDRPEDQMFETNPAYGGLVKNPFIIARPKLLIVTSEQDVKSEYDNHDSGDPYSTESVFKARNRMIEIAPTLMGGAKLGLVHFAVKTGIAYSIGEGDTEDRGTEKSDSLTEIDNESIKRNSAGSKIPIKGRVGMAWDFISFGIGADFFSASDKGRTKTTNTNETISDADPSYSKSEDSSSGSYSESGWKVNGGLLARLDSGRINSEHRLILGIYGYYGAGAQGKMSDENTYDGGVRLETDAEITDFGGEVELRYLPVTACNLTFGLGFEGKKAKMNYKLPTVDDQFSDETLLRFPILLAFAWRPTESSMITVDYRIIPATMNARYSAESDMSLYNPTPLGSYSGKSGFIYDKEEEVILLTQTVGAGIEQGIIDGLSLRLGGNYQENRILQSKTKDWDNHKNYEKSPFVRKNVRIGTGFNYQIDGLRFDLAFAIDKIVSIYQPRYTLIAGVGYFFETAD